MFGLASSSSYSPSKLTRQNAEEGQERKKKMKEILDGFAKKSKSAKQGQSNPVCTGPSWHHGHRSIDR